MKRSLLVLMAIGFIMTGCGKQETEGKGTAVSAQVVSNVQMPELKEIPIPKNQNLLTGLGNLSEKAIGKRPVAVMINNVQAALPQYGISQADIIFELPVEGDLTRLMALYADYSTMPDICAIRSCRYYYPAIAKGFDAFYVHWGIDPSVTDMVAKMQPDKYDGMSNKGGLFGRDSGRINAGYSREHTGYFKGTQFASVVDKSGDRTALRDSKTGTAFRFADFGELVTPTGGTCNSAEIKFGACTSKFTYNAETNTYDKFMKGKAHVDGKTGEQLSFTNVFVLETSISVRDDVGHKKLDWQGSGSSRGYYISNGAVQRIRWSQSSESNYLKFYDENGNELEINRGKSYIAYTSSGRTTVE